MFSYLYRHARVDKSINQNSSTSAAREPPTISKARKMLITLANRVFFFFVFVRVVKGFSF